MKKQRFKTLAAVDRAVVACELCPRLREHCETVAREKRRMYRDETYWGKPVPAFGDPQGRLLIVGLAPAAHGANRTGRMFTGDASGDWLYEALHRHGFASQAESTARGDGLTLADCRITAAARCAPPGNKPTAEEFDHCRPYLEAELALMKQVRVVLVLGRIAHDAWLKASGWWATLPPRERPAFGHGAKTRMPDGTWLLSSFHPSRQNTNTGKLTRPMWYGVFRTVRKLLDRGG